MSRLTLKNHHHLAKQVLGDHPRMGIFDLIYEIEENLIPSEALNGDSEIDFEPHIYTGLVFQGSGVAFLQFEYAFDGSDPEEIDLDSLIEKLPGIALVDNDLVLGVSTSPTSTIAGIAAQVTDNVVISRLYFNPLIGRVQAIGLLKGALSFMQEHSSNGSYSS